MSSTSPPASTLDVTSSDATIPNGNTTPSSSPPDAFPWEQRSEQPCATNHKSNKPLNTPAGPFKNVFSILGKRKPLSPSAENARPPKTSKLAGNGLQQMQMSLGQKVQKKCETCGMEYVASSAEDRKLHDKYHKQNVDGIDVGKDFILKLRKEAVELPVFKGVREGDAIAHVDLTHKHHRKRKAQAVLEVVQRELGAVEIPEKEIWDLKHQTDGDTITDPKYKTFLYVRGSKCIALLLVEKIHQAREVVRPETAAAEAETLAKKAARPDSKNLSALEKLMARKQQEEDAAKAVQEEIDKAASHPLKLSDSSHAAVMGVSRIWTSSSARGQGIGRCLLNTAINRHNSVAERDERDRAAFFARGNEDLPALYDIPRRIERKQDVAFSQPTEAGARLARKWFGRAYGWRVYLD